MPVGVANTKTGNKRVGRLKSSQGGNIKRTQYQETERRDQQGRPKCEEATIEGEEIDKKIKLDSL